MFQLIVSRRYWDWASDDTKSRIPAAAAAETLSVVMPGPRGGGRAGAILNPLLKYRFANRQPSSSVCSHPITFYSAEIDLHTGVGNDYESWLRRRHYLVQYISRVSYLRDYIPRWILQFSNDRSGVRTLLSDYSQTALTINFRETLKESTTQSMVRNLGLQREVGRISADFWTIVDVGGDMTRIAASAFDPIFW